MTAKQPRVAQPFSAEAKLKRALRNHLRVLGFSKDDNGDLVLPDGGKEVVRNLHRSQWREKMATAQPLIARALPQALPHFANGAEIDPKKIKFRLILVRSDTAEADLFRIATLTWSVPVSPGFGRRIRYLVWDDGHNRLAGVIALGDPVYNLSVRDNEIGWDVHDRAKRLVGLLDAYVLGAVPPYSFLLGGKAVACLIRSKDVLKDFNRAYGKSIGVISKSAKHAKLLAVTTTSSMGRSSVYNRLRLGDLTYLKPLGFTKGFGHFHITDSLFEKMRAYLRERDHDYADKHIFGEGPNWRLRAIRAALVGLNVNENILKHGIQREVFISTLAENAYEVLKDGTAKPDFSTLRSVSQISDLARERWIVPRAERGEIDYRSWTREQIPNLIKRKCELPTATKRGTG
ncbi:DUF4338 domain-containing protein [Mesorhizobium sp. BR115XR7A]|uniref:Druantia anti-phage system protein DruA n=1 Tax=Mesorhizobium sp. BR115XR7A TaxID=2876645 RepID=UPI001CCBCB79|nr:Druantia anti-phage system protein DruA [Mesorhizobium sp. BR115XR7A]MBZ9907744.1 DUF4338 domain-containing protein [Mesorhizobium sp. BR115XR7A]MBZ9929053.1 DUF4338 domain-containing protein [Mesorhizobium sp. BR1-1-5]